MQKGEVYGKFVIYGLVDPRDNLYFYVGRTRRPNNRLLQHVSEAEKYKNSKEITIDELFGVVSRIDPDASNKRKLGKINSIKSDGYEPQFVILDTWECNDVTDANRLEDAWIAHMRLCGYSLTNKTLSHRMNPKWYSKDRKGWKEGYYTSPEEYIQWLKNTPYEIRHKKKDTYSMTIPTKKYYKKRRTYGKKQKTKSFFRSK